VIVIVIIKIGFGCARLFVEDLMLGSRRPSISIPSGGEKLPIVVDSGGKGRGIYARGQSGEGRGRIGAGGVPPLL